MNRKLGLKGVQKRCAEDIRIQYCLHQVIYKTELHVLSEQVHKWSLAGLHSKVRSVQTQQRATTTLPEAEMLGKSHVKHRTEFCMGFYISLALVTAACMSHKEQGGTVRLLSNGCSQCWVGKSCPVRVRVGEGTGGFCSSLCFCSSLL